MKNGRSMGVALENGDEFHADVVVSGLDPKRTFLKLVEERELPDDFVDDIRRFKFRGSSGKVNLALCELPLTCMEPANIARWGGVPFRRSATCAARSRSARRWSTSSARTTTRSTASSRADPYMDIVIPSMIDPGMAPPGKHVMSIFVQYAPYAHRRRLGRREARSVRRRGRRRAGAHAPNIKSAIIATAGADAGRHRAHHGSHRGQHLPGRAGAASALLPAPRAGLREVPHADRRLLAVRRGHASRRRHHGRIGAARRTGDPRRARHDVRRHRHRRRARTA